MSEATDLAGAAGAGLDDVPGEVSGEGHQESLEGTDYTKVKFVGVSYDSLETEISLQEEMTFMVRGRVVGVGDEVMNDGHVRHIAKVKVDSVIRKDGD